MICLRRHSIVPVTLREARVFVDRVHRHHRAPQGGLFAVAVADDAGVVRGVAIVGNPVARMLDDGWSVEITRLAVDSSARNACSILYGAAWRAARALGYRRAVTYTLASERGTSLRAAGWRAVAEVEGQSWNRPSRPRVDVHPLQAKIRWERAG
jgi:hypothetical protein